MTVPPPVRRRLELEGRLQGVGFRPFVYRLARALDLTGRVLNTPQGVRLEVQGDATRVERFESMLRSDLPPHARIRREQASSLPTDDAERDFRIQPSETDAGRMAAEILPDLATCRDCAREFRDPANRRYRYPFTNCMHCGPRFSILERLPYDRARTTMRAFKMCPACRSEFENPADRRFHAQPNCCPDCGPSLALQDREGQVLARRERALADAIEAIRGGRIVAVLGVGGFHLICDAANDAAVARLRKTKGRKTRPFAVMFPSIEAIREVCEVSALEEKILSGPEAPILLLRQKAGAQEHTQYSLSRQVAPGIPSLGVFLPYTPLHLLLLDALQKPLVATSGNVSDEPICFRASEAVKRLGGLADLFLVHDRPIAHSVDDSVARVIAGEVTLIRAGRGYAPFVVDLPEAADEGQAPFVAVGAHQKNSVALHRGDALVVGPHVGNLDTVEAIEAHQGAIEALARIHGLDTRQLPRVADLHPDYVSARLAEERGPRPDRVQHHHAHVLSGMAEHGLRGPVLGVAWDGTGYGTDGTIWGGEFLRVGPQGFERVAWLRPFALPGGENAVREPWRVAVALASQTAQISELPLHFSGVKERELAVVRSMLARGLNSPRTSSVGRLFDGVAALLGVCARVDYEGQAAVELEYAAAREPRSEAYPIVLRDGMLDWTPMLERLIADLLELQKEFPVELSTAVAERRKALGGMAWKFHAALAAGIVKVALSGFREMPVLLTGGCFQNRLLTELTEARLRAAGFEVYCHHRVPPNDGGIALGQLWGRVIGQKLNPGGV